MEGTNGYSGPSSAVSQKHPRCPKHTASSTNTSHGLLHLQLQAEFSFRVSTDIGYHITSHHITSSRSPVSFQIKHQIKHSKRRFSSHQTNSESVHRSSQPRLTHLICLHSCTSSSSPLIRKGLRMRLHRNLDHSVTYPHPPSI